MVLGLKSNQEGDAGLAVGGTNVVYEMMKCLSISNLTNFKRQ